MEMEELHAAASAYFCHGTPELQQLARSFFQSMDTNNDGRISSSEFYEFLQQSGYNWIVNGPSFFEKLDRNRDSGLDFSEVLTFYYIIKTRNILCRGCRVYLCGLYFTCVACFDLGLDRHGTYDLCAACYRNSNFYHHHTYFLDNHVLLRSKRGLPPCAPPDLNLTRNILCRGCRVYLCGLYFTCVACFDLGLDHHGTYDLCAACYRDSNFYHHHTYFLDNHVLLRSKRGLPPCAPPDLNLVMTPVPPSPLVIYNSYYFQAPETSKWCKAYRLFETAVAAASMAASCTIM